MACAVVPSVASATTYTTSYIGNVYPSTVGAEALDGSGDVFFLAQNGGLWEATPSGTSYMSRQVIPYVTGSALAVDPAGDIFIAGSNGEGVIEETPRISGGYSQTVVDSTVVSPTSMVSIPGTNGVVLVDTGGGGPGQASVVEEMPDGHGGFTRTVIGDFGLSEPYGIAVDGSDDFFVTDIATNSVYEETPNGAGGYAQSVVDNTNLTEPLYVAVGSSGHVYILDSHNVWEESPDGSGGYTANRIGGASNPLGVAVDPSGDVFISDGADSSVVKLTPQQSDTTPPSIAVTHTVDGQNGYNVSSPVTETVTASDSGSGLGGGGG
jgi:hypothetical protein